MGDYSNQSDCVEAQVLGHQSSLIGFVYRILGDLEAAKDVVQDAFLKLANQDCCGLGNQRAWLYTVSRNLGIQQLRRRKFRADEVVADEVEWADEGAVLPGFGFEQAERYAELRAFLPELTARQREVIELRYFQQLSCAEIAEVCGEKINNIYQLHHAGLIALRKLIES